MSTKLWGMMTKNEQGKDEGVGNQECFENRSEVVKSPISTTVDDLACDCERLSVDVLSSCENKNGGAPNILICDAGYGFPKEKRPKKEKINAIANQLSNFLAWQIRHDEHGGNSSHMAEVQVVGCPDEVTRSVIEKKISENLKVTRLPSHLSLSCDTLEEVLASDENGWSEPPVYLSPDADGSLNPSCPPPTKVVVGLLIDRRVQPNRSKERAFKLNVVAKRWPLEDCFVEISAREPLNVDCVLEGMQRWWWNSRKMDDGDKEAFVLAASQAIDNHARRHPSRPLHVLPGS